MLSPRLLLFSHLLSLGVSENIFTVQCLEDIYKKIATALVPPRENAVYCIAETTNKD